MNPKQRRRVDSKQKEVETVSRFFVNALFGDTEETLSQLVEQENAVRRPPPRRGGP